MKKFKKARPEILLRVVHGKMYIGKDLLPEMDAKQIITEAKQIKKFLIWELLNNNMRDTVIGEMYNKWRNAECGLMGKAMLDTITGYEQLIDKIINSKLDYKDK